MKHVILQYALILFTAINCIAQDDVKIGETSITFTKVTPEGLKLCSNPSEKMKANCVLTIKKNVTQKDFDIICNTIPWAKQLLVSFSKDISNISAVSQLKGLTYVRLNGLKQSQITPLDVSPLKDLKKLKTIDFLGTKVSNISSLKNLNQLEFVALYSSDVDDITFLEGKTKVKKLTLAGSGHTFKNYESLKGLVNLK